MSRKTGLWLIGAFGGVSTTVAVGLAALKNNSCQNIGLVSGLPDFDQLDLVDWSNIVLGGHDIRDTNVAIEAEKLCRGTTPVFAPEYVAQAKIELEQFNDNICPGVTINAGKAIDDISDNGHFFAANNCNSAIEKIQSDLQKFKAANHCDRVIVINLASTEPPVETDAIPNEPAAFSKFLDDPACSIPPSSLYAYAAIDIGMPFVNFTPSIANRIPAICKLAEEKNVCHMGHDGKTGETFLKSVLAPAFAQRNLNIMSWVGHNIFGNMDGVILDDPENKKTKVDSKGLMLNQMLGYQPQSHISIEYIKSLGDWKTAWDHIHFQGFLGTTMTMQFTWQGCDSILAAPLVLDLFRFTELANRKGESGLMLHLSSFFKSPMETDDHVFSSQFEKLLNWASKHSEKS
ncbi:MAG: inositol-3-phosphate synthase [Planctomycetota bacterium]